jgi:hypothetical protein
MFYSLSSIFCQLITSYQPFQSSAQEVAVIIGFKSCVPSPGLCSIDTLGNILFNGLYRPTLHPTGSSGVYQDIDITIPSGVSAGQAVISVAHFSLIGVSLLMFTARPAISNRFLNLQASLNPFVETVNSTVTIA